MLPQPRAYRPEELKPGVTAEFEKDITEEDVLTFARNSGDMNPLHVDPQYAKTTNFGRRVVHGAYQVGLASAMVGMYLPGRDVLLVSSNAHFSAPLYFPSRVKVHGELVSWNEKSLRGNVKVTVSTLPAATVVSEIHMGVTFHEQRETAVQESTRAIPPVSTSSTGRTLLITGAAGGVGSALATDLAADYRVIAAMNTGSLPEQLANHENVSSIRVNFADPGWEQQIREILGDTRLYGVVHCAWPGMPHGGLLKVPAEVVAQQISFGAGTTVAIARLLTERVDSSGGRFVALSSIVGTHKPSLNLAAYSLGKATLENAISLLAPELALKKITANAICPTFMPTGMNQQANARQKMTEAALIPMGRVCNSADVAGIVRYLLSDAGSFLSGESIALAGGQVL
jgi:NAD(P)-dependent dehydrogenase (short-subunit alcohol dehydrogenase family)/acyl dehydratase